MPRPITQRRRNNTISYELQVVKPNDEIEYHYDIDNLERLSAIINVNYFSGFRVVSRNMVSNWIHYPDRPRREFGERFIISKYDNSNVC